MRLRPHAVVLVTPCDLRGILVLVQLESLLLGQVRMGNVARQLATQYIIPCNPGHSQDGIQSRFLKCFPSDDPIQFLHLKAQD